MTDALSAYCARLGVVAVGEIVADGLFAGVLGCAAAGAAAAGHVAVDAGDCPVDVRAFATGLVVAAGSWLGSLLGRGDRLEPIAGVSALIHICQHLLPAIGWRGATYSRMCDRLEIV